METENQGFPCITVGNTRVRIHEVFRTDGKQLEQLVQEYIMDAVRRDKKEEKR